MSKAVNHYDIDRHDIDPHDVDPHDVDPHDVDPHDVDPHDVDPHDVDPHDVDLMRYADQELDPDSEEAAAIASFIAANPDAGRKIEVLDQMSEVVRARLELAADEAEPRLDAMWTTIERRIQANGARQAVPAVPTAPIRSSTAEHGGLWAAIGRFFEQYRGHFLTGAVAAGAAAVLILALRPPAPVVVEAPVAVGGQNTGQGSAATAGGAQELVNHSAAAQVKLVNDDPSPPEIEQLEVTGGSGTVFVMPSEGEDDVAATVIFLETDDVEGPL